MGFRARAGTPPERGSRAVTIVENSPPEQVLNSPQSAAGQRRQRSTGTVRTKKERANGCSTERHQRDSGTCCASNPMRREQPRPLRAAQEPEGFARSDPAAEALAVPPAEQPVDRVARRVLQHQHLAPRDAPGLGEQERLVHVGHVVEHERQQHDVEAPVREGEPQPIEHREPPHGNPAEVPHVDGVHRTAVGAARSARPRTLPHIPRRAPPARRPDGAPPATGCDRSPSRPSANETGAAFCPWRR